MKQTLRVITICLAFFLFYSVCRSQVTIKGSVKDKDNKELLPFCSISISGTSRGCITNSEGVFQITINPTTDTLIFSFIGYTTKFVKGSYFIKSSEIYLEKKNLFLNEIVIHGDDSFLYEAIEKCKKKINVVDPLVSKIYFEVETDKLDQPVELLQSYYNGYFNGISIKKLLLKNGRAGWSKIDDGYFFSSSTSLAISSLNLVNNNSFFPSHPLQYSSKKLKKHYKLNEISIQEEDMYYIEFKPIIDNGKFFKGGIWFEKENFSIHKIHLLIDNAQIHPFLPMPDGTIENVNLDITMNFTKHSNQNVLEYISFQYNMNYSNNNPPLRSNNGTNETYKISTTGLMHMYDYDNPFLLPYFEYDPEQDDYRKITFIPYNEFFWKNNLGLLSTEKQRQKIDYFKEYGILLNHCEENDCYGLSSNDQWRKNRSFYETSNIFWSDKNRLSLRSALARKDSIVKNNLNQAIPSDLYNIKVQLFLEVNQFEDSLQHYSATVFDVFQTFYLIPEELNTNVFINIYFDICEIERRKMEATLSTFSHSLSELDTLYHKTTNSMEGKTKLYLKEVQTGKNWKELLKWNKYVMDNLGIDNIVLFQN